MADSEKSGKRGWLRGFKIGCLSLVSLFLIIVFAVVGWFFYVTREVEVHDEDMVVAFTNIPDGKNGYFALEKARKEVEESGFDTGAYCVTNDIPSDENLNASHLFIKEHPDVLNTFYSVAGYEYCQAPLQEGVPLIAQKEMRVSRLISLGNLSLCHIESLIREGNHPQALDCLESHLRVGQMINSGGRSLVTGMLGLVLNRMATELLVAHLSAGTFFDADFDRIRKMMANLDENNDWVHMIRVEYTVSKSVALSLSQEMDLPPNIPRRFSHYVYNESVALSRFARFFHEEIESINNPAVQPSCDLIQRKDDVSEGEAFRLWVSGKVVSQMLYNIMIPSFKNIGPAIRDSWAKDELIKLYLAIWKYHMENRALPTQLELLVPDYVPVVPSDPCAKGQLLQYDPKGQKIYSIGSRGDEQLSISLGFAD